MPDKKYGVYPQVRLSVIDGVVEIPWPDELLVSAVTVRLIVETGSGRCRPQWNNQPDTLEAGYELERNAANDLGLWNGSELPTHMACNRNNDIIIVLVKEDTSDVVVPLPA